MKSIRLFSGSAKDLRGLRAGGVLLLMVLFGIGIPLQAVESYPPLVPQGEKINDIRELVKNISRNSGVLSVAFSPDGKNLASGSWDSTVRLWDLSSDKEIKRLEGHTNPVTSVAFSPDGKTLASGSYDNSVCLWDLRSGKKIWNKVEHTNGVRSVSISPDGKTLASGAGDGTVRLWDLNSGKEIALLEGHTNIVTSVSFSPDGKALASGSLDGSVHLWDLGSGNEILCLKEYPYPNAITSIAISPDSKTLASVSYDGSVHLWDHRSGFEIQHLVVEGRRVGTSVVFNPDGKILASGSLNQGVRFWDLRRGNESPRLEEYQYSWDITPVAFRPDGKIFAFGTSYNTVHLWDFLNGKEIRCLEGHTNFVTSITFSPDGKTLASESGDNTIRIWDLTTHQPIKRLLSTPENRQTYFNPERNISPDGTIFISLSADSRAILLRRIPDGETLWTFIGGQNGNWLSFNQENWVWRGDDGSFLVKKDEYGRITPLMPPPPKSLENIRFAVLEKPSKLETYDGEATGFTLELKNTGSENLYWLNVVQQTKDLPAEKNPLVFHPPATQIILEPGKSATLACKVSAASPYTNPKEQSATLYLQITSAYGTPVALEIPVNIHVPQLKLLKAILQEQEKNVLIVTLQNIGQQDLAKGIIVTCTIANVTTGAVVPLDTVEKKVIKQGETFDITFSVPKNLQVNWQSRLNMLVRKSNQPAHEWLFQGQSIVLTKPAWYWYILFAVLALAALGGLYYLRLYLHPLVTQLSKSPIELLHLEPTGLERAQNLLNRTHRLDTVLSGAEVSKSRLKKAIAFYHDENPEHRLHILAQQLEAKQEPFQEINTLPLDPIIHLFQLQLSSDFMLNLDRCIVAFPAPGAAAGDILKNLRQVEILNYRVCILVTLDDTQQTALRKESLNTENLLVTPSGKELTHLLLSKDPLTPLARLIACQVKLTHVSPYHIKGGVDRESIFFGRKQLLAQVMQRNPANYFLVGGRQVGKSSLLKAIDRRYKESPLVQCRYLSLTSETIAAKLAHELELPENAGMSGILDYLGRSGQSKRRLFLIDEADKFIETEARSGYPTLHHFRALSEKGLCHFIFFFFWALYHSAAFDYQSPIKNFGETFKIEALETDACRDLAMKPLELLNIRYESGALVDQLLYETGCRANLVAIICNEMLKYLDMKERVIGAHHLARAMESDEVRTALSGWGKITGDAGADRLDRVIVYAAARETIFTAVQLMRILDKLAFRYEPEALHESLVRLELAFIFKREKQEYSYAVPLFKKMILDRDPEEMLSRELRT